MIVKIFKPAQGFGAVRYNTGKIDKNKGELLTVANFGPLEGLSGMTPQDYVNYLTLLSSQNTRIRLPAFHAVISAKGRTHHKYTLNEVAVSWMKEMGYDKQPYLIVFHKDTLNNHVHIVSTRVDRSGQKINSGFEGVKAVQALNNVLGYGYGLGYNISTRAQFYMLLEQADRKGKDMNNKILDQHIAKYRPEKERAQEIRSMLIDKRYDGLELIFHSTGGKTPYGYTIIDHAQKNVFKGSEVLPLRELKNNSNLLSTFHQLSAIHRSSANSPVYVLPLSIANDVDDQRINGRNRRKKKSRTNKR